jgi:RimJ/RimL family protein N-acetyltransferase/acyl carrier protein
VTLSADEFVDRLRDTVGTLRSPERTIGLDTRVINDLKFDSFQLVMLIEFLSDLLGSDFEPDDEEAIRLGDTVRSVYQLYLERASAPSGVRMTALGDSAIKGKVVSLRPLEPADYKKLFSLAVSGSTAWRWRYAGVLPSYEEWLQTLNSGVLSQLVVTDSSEDVMGLVVAYNANLNNGTVYAAAMVAPGLVGSGRGAEAVILFFRYIFATWSVVKVYMEVPEFNIEQFGSALDRGTCEIEGRLRGHLVYDGRRWDQIILSVSREKFLERWGKSRCSM